MEQKRHSRNKELYIMEWKNFCKPSEAALLLLVNFCISFGRKEFCCQFPHVTSLWTWFYIKMVYDFNPDEVIIIIINRSPQAQFFIGVSLRLLSVLY